MGGRSPRPIAGSVPLGVVLAAALCLACGTPPLPIEYLPNDGATTRSDALQRVRSQRVGALLLKPGARLGDYTGVVVDEVPVSQSSPSPRRYGLAKARAHRPLGPEGVDRLQRILHQSLEQELDGSPRFALAAGPGPGVLRISARVTDLVWEVHPLQGSEDNFVQRVGAMTLVVDVRDSVSGELLLRLADRREIRSTGSASSIGSADTPVRNWAHVREVSATWSRVLRSTLDALHAMPEVPWPGAPPRS